MALATGEIGSEGGKRGVGVDELAVRRSSCSSSSISSSSSDEADGAECESEGVEGDEWVEDDGVSVLLLAVLT